MSLNYVRFDVGHYLHVCHKQTIEKYPNSTLAKYIAPEFDTRTSSQDYIVIDRDGKHFGSILNFMRDASSLDLEELSDNDLGGLMREADFYCLGELVELCGQEVMKREQCCCQSNSYAVPSSHKLEIIIGLKVIRELLVASAGKPTIAISHKTIRHFGIESWFTDLLQLCDHENFHVYCFADKDCNARICNQGPPLTLKSFIVALYHPGKKTFVDWVGVPSDERFRDKRARFKCKIYKFWMLAQNDISQALKRQKSIG